MNSLFLTDGYKTSHNKQYPEGTTLVFSNFTPRSDNHANEGLKNKGVVVFGIQYMLKVLKEHNCGKLYLAVSHMTVLELGKDTVGNYFDRVFTTNSKFEEDYTSDGNTNLAGVTKFDIF